VQLGASTACETVPYPHCDLLLSIPNTMTLELTMQHAALQLSAPLMTSSLAPAASSTPTPAGQAPSELQVAAAGTQQQQQQQEASEGASAAVEEAQATHQESSGQQGPLKFHEVLLHVSIGVVKGGRCHRVASLWARRKVGACFYSSYKMAPAVFHCPLSAVLCSFVPSGVLRCIVLSGVLCCAGR
jgi:hypothetical protein